MLKVTPKGLFIDHKIILVLHKLQQYEQHRLRREENLSGTQIAIRSQRKTASSAISRLIMPVSRLYNRLLKCTHSLFVPLVDY